MDGKDQAWRDAADRLIDALARDHQYIVGDMVVLFLESAGYGLDNYTALGGAFKRAAKRGTIRRVSTRSKHPLWVSNLYKKNGEQ